MSNAFEAQIKKYTEQLAQDPKSRVFVPLSDIYRKLGQYDEAIAVAQEGLKHHPNYMGGKTVLARAYFENGDLDPAQEILEYIIEFAPDNLLANRILSEIYVQKGKPDQARPILKRLLAMEPGDDRAKRQLNAIEKGQTARVEPPAKEGATLAGPPATKTSPPTETATLANLYRSQGHLEKALGIYKKLKDQEPGNPSHAQAIAEIEAELGKKRTARPETRFQVDYLNKLLHRIQERRRKL